MTEVDVTRNDATGRFETIVDGHLAELTFRRVGDRLILVHTGVPEEIAHHGLAGALAEAAFRFAAAEHLTVVPQCPYVRGWMAKHPDEVEKVTLESP